MDMYIQIQRAVFRSRHMTLVSIPPTLSKRLAGRCATEEWRISWSPSATSGTPGDCSTTTGRSSNSQITGEIDNTCFSKVYYS